MKLNVHLISGILLEFGPYSVITSRDIGEEINKTNVLHLFHEGEEYIIPRSSIAYIKILKQDK